MGGVGNLTVDGEDSIDGHEDDHDDECVEHPGNCVEESDDDLIERLWQNGKCRE